MASLHRQTHTAGTFITSESLALTNTFLRVDWNFVDIKTQLDLILNKELNTFN